MAASYDDLVQAVETSDIAFVRHLKDMGLPAEDAWNAHLALFPAAQKVLNPPFINPHLPKMYAVIRDFYPCLEPEDIAGLLRMEAMEYTRRPKMAGVERVPGKQARVSFADVEVAIREGDLPRVASLLAAFCEREGGEELAGRLLLLGSGYLDRSLGHSVSCTAFILLEMLDRPDQDPWPALAMLSDYFCKGDFGSTPVLRRREEAARGISPDDFLRSTTGSSFEDLHHTIALYAIERASHLLSVDEHDHMIASWRSYVGRKEAGPGRIEPGGKAVALDYPAFFDGFSRFDLEGTLARGRALIGTEQGRAQLCRFLVRALCDAYHGYYNPHYVTGLGAALWIIGCYWSEPAVSGRALRQYLEFLFRGLQSND